MPHVSKPTCTEDTINEAGNLEPQKNNQILLACILLLPKDAAPILALLRQANTNSGSSNVSQLADVHSIPLTQPQGDSWLAHSEAADYLGVAKSTLYRFVCEGRIETRKIGGRLEYRRATLDKFKEQQIRPARRSRTRGIITPTLGSGK
ncbi:MAG: helix-turn-helix domain-containing protein [Candidatus Acidiferrales bacterium]